MHRVCRSFAVIACLLASSVVATTGCTRGKKRSGEAAAPERPAAVETTEPVDDWAAGRLPDSVNEGEPKPGGTLVVRLYSEPPSLDLITDSDYVTTLMLERHVYESMAVIDGSRAPEFPLKPVLATSWEISPDRLTYTFHLRRGVKWHDGQPFTAHDVVATLDKIRDPKVRAMRLRASLEGLVEAKAVDDHTFVARWDRPYFMAFRFLALLRVYPKHILDVAGDMLQHPIHRAPVGTGPFRFESWQTADRITYVRNDAYWGRKAHLDRLVYRFVTDETVAFQLLQKGDFDLFLRAGASAWAVDMHRIPAIRAQYHRVKWFFPNYSFIGWNTQHPFLADPKVRTALTLLIDREGVRQRFLFGLDETVTCHFFRESAACDPTLEPLPWDPKRARELLDEAGWLDRDGNGVREKDGVEARLSFLIPSGSTLGPRLGAWMQHEFGKNGIVVELKRVEWSIYSQKLRDHDFDVCTLAWGSTDVVGDPYQVWHSSQANQGSNFVSYSNPEVDRLIEEARATLDDAARNELFRRFGRILHEEAPYTFLYTRANLDLVKRHVKGLRPQLPWYTLHDVWLDTAAVAGTP